MVRKKRVPVTTYKFLNAIFRWVKNFQIGRSASGRRVSVLQFVRKQRQRTKSRLAMVKRRKSKGNPYLSMGLAKEKWRRGGRKDKRSTYMTPLEPMWRFKASAAGMITWINLSLYQNIHVQ